MKELTDKQQRFINEYPKDFNATQAAIRAGYSANSAGVIAHRLLKNPRVAREIEKRRGEIEEKTDVQIGEIVKELRQLAFGGRKATNTERLRALELLGKYKCMYTDKTEVKHGVAEQSKEFAAWLAGDSLVHEEGHGQTVTSLGDSAAYPGGDLRLGQAVVH